MLESQWRTCVNPEPMLARVHGLLTPRKMRLFACALCRQVEPNLGDRRAARALDIAERFAEGEADARELRRGRVLVHKAIQQCNRNWHAAYHARLAVRHLTEPEGVWLGSVLGAIHAALDVNANLAAWENWLGRQAGLLRDLFNPFRPAENLEWRPRRDSTVGRLARALAERRQFDHLPILGDALEEAGCEDFDVLDHCRAGGPHHRGCWVLDLCLDRN